MADAIVLVPSAAVTASGTAGVSSGFADRTKLRAQLNVTAVSGTAPTLDVVLEDTLDGVNWNPLLTFTQVTAAGRQVMNLPGNTGVFADQIRVRYTVGGATPSFTFDVRLHAD